MILKNAIETPDGTILESHFRHDYNCHLDRKTKKTYFVDGGRDYFCRSAHGDEIDLSIEATDDHHFNRQHFTWGTYGKDGKGPFARVRLADMASAHIEAILETQHHISANVRNLFVEEVKLRKEEGIY